MGFFKRYDKNPLLRYFTAADFNLKATPLKVESGGVNLRGYIYGEQSGNIKNDKDDKPCKGAVVFCHGLGPGQAAYTTEIAYFCSLGYTVYALDARGCGCSEGKAIKGFVGAVEAAELAVKVAREAGHKKVYLVGHSMGGYAALCASKTADAVVALGAPDTPAAAISSAASNYMPKPLAAMLKPFLALNFIISGGKRGNTGAAKCIKASGTPALIIQGALDTTVKLNVSAYQKADGKNVTKLLLADKRHNPYNTVRAEDKLAELSANLAKIKDGNNFEYFQKFDFALATEEDGAVMNEIAAFLEQN